MGPGRATEPTPDRRSSVRRPSCGPASGPIASLATGRRWSETCGGSAPRRETTMPRSAMAPSPRGRGSAPGTGRGFTWRPRLPWRSWADVSGSSRAAPRVPPPLGSRSPSGLPLERRVVTGSGAGSITDVSLVEGRDGWVRPILRETPQHLSVWNRNRARTRLDTACPDPRPVHLAIDMGPPRPSHPPGRHGDGSELRRRAPSWPPILGSAIALDLGHTIADPPTSRERGRGEAGRLPESLGCKVDDTTRSPPPRPLSSDPGDGLRLGRRGASRRHRAPLCKGPRQRACTAVVKRAGMPARGGGHVHGDRG